MIINYVYFFFENKAVLARYSRIIEIYFAIYIALLMCNVLGKFVSPTARPLLFLPLMLAMFLRKSVIHSVYVLRQLHNNVYDNCGHAQQKVAQLAEACAGAIGEDSELARAAAYYHDVGKLIAGTHSKTATTMQPKRVLIFFKRKIPIVPTKKIVKRLAKLSIIGMEPPATSVLFKNLLKINIISANSQFTKIASLLLKNIASISGKNNRRKKFENKTDEE